MSIPGKRRNLLVFYLLKRFCKSSISSVPSSRSGPRLLAGFDWINDLQKMNAIVACTENEVPGSQAFRCGTRMMWLLIISVNEMLCVKPPPTPVTVTLYVPKGVAWEVVTVQITGNDGFTIGGLSDAYAPYGSPDTETFTV